MWARALSKYVWGWRSCQYLKAQTKAPASSSRRPPVKFLKSQRVKNVLWPWGWKPCLLIRPDGRYSLKMVQGVSALSAAPGLQNGLAWNPADSPSAAAECTWTPSNAKPGIQICHWHVDFEHYQAASLLKKWWYRCIYTCGNTNNIYICVCATI